jgi:hypothetical protein
MTTTAAVLEKSTGGAVVSLVFKCIRLFPYLFKLGPIVAQPRLEPFVLVHLVAVKLPLWLLLLLVMLVLVVVMRVLLMMTHGLKLACLVHKEGR